MNKDKLEKLTPEMLETLGFKKLPHYTVQNSMIKDIGRDRILSVGCIGTPNEMLFIEEVEGKEVKNIVVLHNYDYDGFLSFQKLKTICNWFVTNLLQGEALPASSGNDIEKKLYSRQEAIELMKQGHKLTHRHFASYEWVMSDKRGIRYDFEDGVECTSKQFWNDRSGTDWETDWKLFNDNS